MPKNFEIKNSTAEFLMFVMDGKENGVQVTYKDETIWCTQKAMATLFDVGVPAISKHLKNIFDTGELSEKSVISILETTASDGKSYKTSFYSLDAIISVGYRVNSANGQPIYCGNLPYVGMLLIKSEWKMVHSLVKTISSICLPKSGR